MKPRDLWRRLAVHAVTQPDAVALDDGRGRQHTWGQLLPAISEAAAALRASGSTCLGLLADNGPAWSLADLGALALGITMVPLPGFFSDEQLRHVLARSGVDALLTDDAERVARLAPGFVPAAVPAAVALGDLTLWHADAPVANAERVMPRNPSGAAPRPTRVTFTSGTTGAPKGVCLSASALLRVAASLAGATEMGRHDRHLCALPLSILLENVGGLYRGLLAGARVVLPPLTDVGLAGSSCMDAERLAGALRRARASSAILMPQMLQELVRWGESGPRDWPDALAFVGVGGAPVPLEWQQRAAALGLPVFEGYGLSEAASVVALNTRRAHRAGSVGRPLPHVRLAIAADGEICVGGALFDGYLSDPSDPGAGRPRPPLRDGLWCTGDIGHVDGDGFLFVHGRRDDLLITSFGRNLEPTWVEHELCSLPGVAQAAVVADAHPGLMVVLVTEADAPLQPGSLERLNAGLPDYARVSRCIPAREAFTRDNRQLDLDGRPCRAVIARLYAAELAPAPPDGIANPSSASSSS